MFWKHKRLQIGLDQHIPLCTPIAELSFTVFDTETTGFSVESNDRLIEIGAVQVSRLEVTDKTFQTYVNPHRKIPQEIVQLTGIDQSKAGRAPDALEGIELFCQFVEQQQSSCWVGHFLSFDMTVIKKELQREKRRFEKPVSIDTLDLIRFLHPAWKTMKLEDYTQSFNTPLFQRHTALGDALTTAHLFCVLLQRVQERGHHTWGDILYAVEAYNRHLAFY